MERLIKLGHIKPKHSLEIEHSKIGIGFEKLDRNVFDPEKAYDKVSELGVKLVRIQSGWARTETIKGQYNFGWLDSIVDKLIKRGLIPWICLCYGNGLYDTKAAEVFGAVGCPPIHSEEAKMAWRNYVMALVSHYQEKIEYYEVWNEPDGIWCWKHGVSGKEYGEFAAETAKAAKSVSSHIKIVGGAVCLTDLQYINDALSAGMGDAIDALSFHEYTPNEKHVFERVTSLRALCSRYRPNIEIIQGESGSQSKSGGSGALQGGAWTQKKQAKQLVRHTISDLLSNVKFTSYFSCVDMIEALNGTVGKKDTYKDYGYFGVLGADFDENGFSTGDYTPKLSYFTLQTICSVFSGDFELAELPALLLPSVSPRVFGSDFSGPTLVHGGFQKPNGSSAFTYWNSCDLMTSEFESTVTLQTAQLTGEIKLIDLLYGIVYKIPETMLIDKGNDCLLFQNIPITDYPLLITFGDFI